MAISEEKRKANREYYQKAKKEIQLKKLYREAQTKGRKVKLQTFEKFGIKPDDKGVIKIPAKPKLIIEKEQPTEIRIVQQNPTQIYPKTNTEYTKVNAKQLLTWITNDLIKINVKGQSNTRSKATLTAYATLVKRIPAFIGEKYDEEKDMLPYFNDYDKLITGINNVNVAKGTKAAYLGKLLFLFRNYEPLKEKLPKQIYNIYNNYQISWDEQARAGRDFNKNNVSYFEYGVIKDVVIKQYTKKSYEYLIVKLYEEVICRDDWGVLTVYKEEDMTNPKENYLFIDKSKKTATAYFNSYKTSEIYGDVKFKLSNEVYKLIDELHKGQEQKKLFPDVKDAKGKATRKLSYYIGQMLKSIPMFKDENTDLLKTPYLYLRHSSISTQVMNIKTKNKDDYAKQITDIARKSFHSYGIQNVYVNRLRDANGNIIKKDFDEANEVITGVITRSKSKK